MIRLVLLGLAAYGAAKYVSRHSRRPSEPHALLPAPESRRAATRRRPAASRPDVDKAAMRLAEETDVSPNQAREMIEENGIANAEAEARNFKAES